MITLAILAEMVAADTDDFTCNGFLFRVVTFPNAGATQRVSALANGFVLGTRSIDAVLFEFVLFHVVICLICLSDCKMIGELRAQ